MLLRPTSFSIPSTTELIISFTDALSLSLSSKNFQIISLNGAVDDLEVLSVVINDREVTLKTRPQVSGNYYLLKFLDTDEVLFESLRGHTLPFDDNSRELFFVGIDNVNPIRDRMFDSIPSLFEIENTTIKNIISAQANELYTAQKKIGEVLSNNYLSVDVVDEIRTRSAGATDRLANENAYEILRVSKEPSGNAPKFEILDYTIDNKFSRNRIFSAYPISLQEVTVSDEEISSSTEGNSFDGYLLNLKKNNIIKILSVKFISSTDVEDCEGNIGIDYDIERFKYTIHDNYYDQDYAFSYKKLNTNQVLLSEFSNVSKPTILDRFIVSYLYKDLGRNILEDQVEVSRVENSDNESVPANSTNFFLNHAPIVNSNNEIISIGGLTFSTSENDDSVPNHFSKELVFNSSNLPSKIGEYSVNYKTGEVFVVGYDKFGEGTGRNNFIVSYKFRREFKNTSDYSINDQNIVAIQNRNLSNQEAQIFIRYDKTFAEGVDYLVKSHKEVMPEFVENRLSQSFRITTKNAPITNVFRILNQTTGEVYNTLFNTDNEIAFSGKKSPEIKNIFGEESKFLTVTNESLQVIGEFIAPVFNVIVTSNVSNNSIQFKPGIPAELISSNSSDYFFREVSNEIDVSDTNISFFDFPDSNNQISSAGISATASAPSVGSQVILGTRCYVISLEKTGILNKNLDSLGTLQNTSLEFSDLNLFKRERYFENTDDVSGLNKSSSGGLSQLITSNKDDIFYKNISKLRRVGDYLVDYSRGLIYLSVGLNEGIELGNVNYFYSGIKTNKKNILAVSGVAKKRNGPESLSEASKVYKFSNDSEVITPTDLEHSLTIYDGETKASNEDGERHLICKILDDYTVLVPCTINSINSIFELTDLTGSDLKSSNQSLRLEDATAENLITLKKNGGKNLYEANSVYFNNNIIDFKKSQKRRLVDNGNDLVLTISDANATSFVKAKLATTDQVIFDENLNITKVDDLNLVAITSGIGSSQLDIASGLDLSDVDINEDYLLDQDGNRFLITAVDTILSNITILTPAENTSVSDPIIGKVSVVIKPTIQYTDTGMTITIPIDAPFPSGSLIEVIYLTNLIPAIGSELAIDYRFGFVFVDYAYVADEIAVWYEYGDNSIDWSISDSINEGDQYFVTYKYGALRDALKNNFGNLTNIPFFKSFGINTDRELYRDALIGTLQSFPKGPTVQSYNDLIKSFTKINPNIDELIFGNWVLGRDYLSPENVNYKGVLNFAEGKFDGGLKFNDDVVVDIPALSSINLNEGTLEAWIRPEWSGINNDATLTFDLDHFGKEKFVLTEKSDPFDFSNGWSLFPVNNQVGKINTGSGISIFNFKSDASETFGINVGSYGLYKEQNNLNRTLKSDLFVTAKVNLIGSHFNDLRKIISNPSNGFDYCNNENPNEEFFIIGKHGPGNIIEGPWPFNLASPASIYNVGSIFIADGDRSSGFLFNLTQINEFSFDASKNDEINEILGDEVVNFDRYQFTKNCSCSIDTNIENSLNFSDLQISIELSELFDLSIFKESYNFIESKPNIFILVDSNGIFYQVIGFYESSGFLNKNVLPDSFIKLAVKKFGNNNTSLSAQSSTSINNSLPSGILRLFYKSVDALTKNEITNSINAFNFEKSNVLDWNNFHDYKVSRDPLNNLVSILIDNHQSQMFYTDSFYSCNLSFGLSIESTNLKGLMIGIPSSSILSNLELLKVHSTLENRYDVGDIYIGKSGFNPSRLPFSISRNDFPNGTVGEPQLASSTDGVFIWFDELCTSPMSEQVGQWVCRARSSRVINIPVDVIVSDSNYTNITDSLVLEHNFSGKVLTDGEFSSVSRAYRSENILGCDTGIVCDNSFRYCGKELLEEFGWLKIEETDSSVINAINGGRDTTRERWNKLGQFNTSVSSGIYRMGPSTINSDCIDNIKNLGNVVYTRMPCSGGNYEFTTSFRVVQVTDLLTSTTGLFTGNVSGFFTGIVPVHLLDEDVNIKIALALSTVGQPLIIVLDATSNQIIDIIPYLWNDQNFHEIRIDKDKDVQRITISIDNLLLSQVLISDFLTPTFTNDDSFMNPIIASYLLDFNIVNAEIYLTENVPNVLDIDLLYFASTKIEGDGYLEADDFLTNTDDKIEFNFGINDADGYVDLDGYDGYINLVGVDEMFITSDRVRYLVDTGVDEGNQRFSIFKDGKGFLNFKVSDDSVDRKEQSTSYNLATNIKHFKPGELHHIAASWKFNTIEERDEMHLFVDGQEAPNIFKFGGKVPVQSNGKFRDISKEVLFDFLVNDVDFCQEYVDGTTSAGSSIFTSNQVNFTQNMVGRSILITSSILAPTLVNQEFIIKSVIDSSQITLCRGSGFDLLTFQISTNDINFKFPPTAGLVSPILTDLRNSKLSIFKTMIDGTIEEMAGIYYQIIQGEINIVKGDNVLHPKFRINLDENIIEFVGPDENCEYTSTIEPTDLDVHIETYGLNLKLFKRKINLSASSYTSNEELFSGKSVIRTIESEPVSLEDVYLTRILLDKTVIDVINPEIESNLGYLVDFEIQLNDENGFNKLSSESGQISKQNLGRLINILIDSDNINYCQVDGYSFGYNTITLHGTTTDGENNEIFEIKKNGDINGTKYFTSLERVSGTLLIMDPDYYEAALIQIKELNPLSISDNNGSYAEIYDYQNGNLIITTAGSAGTDPFELHPGYYNLEYPTYLIINLPTVGDKVFIGSDFNEKNQFGGIIDEFRIISELSSDTRSTEIETSGTRSVTDDYNRSIPFCPDSQTLALIHFDNPINYQARRLRNTEFLDTNKNIKYKLSTSKQEALLLLVNDSNKFMSKMLNYGFSLDEANRVYYEVHKANGGPLFNDADYYKNYVEFPKSDNSVNESFGYSGNFTSGKGLLLLNDNGQFRREQGTIEFWVSPIIDTLIDKEVRYYVDISSIKQERIRSTSSSFIELNNAAKEILSVKLLNNSERFTGFYTTEEKSTILFDEISRNNISGRLEGGTGTDNDFNMGAKLSSDGLKIYLSESLPGQNVDVIVTYIPLNSQGDRFSIFKDSNSKIVFAITADGIDNMVSVEVDWKKNSWHRIKCVYKTGTTSDTMRVFVDGDEGGFILYGTGILYGEGYIYGQYMQGSGQFRSSEFNIPLNDEFKLIAIGSTIFSSYNARARIDNIRFSRLIRDVTRDSIGLSVDLNYSSNLNTASPVINDDLTTLLIDFDEESIKLDKFATVINPNTGIYNFDIEVIDNFDRVINVNDGEIEDLIVDLVNRLKPAHTNALVKFTKNRC